MELVLLPRVLVRIKLNKTSLTVPGAVWEYKRTRERAKPTKKLGFSSFPPESLGNIKEAPKHNPSIRVFSVFHLGKQISLTKDKDKLRKTKGKLEKPRKS